MPLRSVRILCFGASITAGWTQYGTMYHPYAHTMMQTLRMAFPEIKLDIGVKGKAGDKVISPPGTFYSRLQEDLSNAVMFEEPYDWVLILGGSNDLAFMKEEGSETKIFSHLEQLYNLCFSHSAKVIAFTIPETKTKVPVIVELRDKVNDLIRNYQRDNFYVFDLNQKIRFLRDSPENMSLWDDGVHFTPKGYSVMGDKVAEFFRPLLKDHIDAMPCEPPSPVSPTTLVFHTRSRRRSSPAEEIDFVEETGDPNILSQGYIVVRKRDLD